jgi:5-methylcytosine-specific restriction endonuclease McrA
MQQHVKVYTQFFGIGEQDTHNPCEWCNRTGHDIHHIHSRGLKGFEHNGQQYDINHIFNLILLCRDCHNNAHGGLITKSQLMDKHKDRMTNHLTQ